MGENAGIWEVFDQVNYEGNNGFVHPGQVYLDPDQMGLVMQVFSIRRVVGN